MKKFLLQEILLLSRQEKKARKIKFNPSVTIILGQNDTGKSSLLKSIYYGLGAEISFHSKWESAGVISLIKFKYDQVDYSILRYKSKFVLFDENFQPLSVVKGIIKGIGPLLAKKFDFNLVLKPKPKQISNNTQGHELPPPAYQYLPFYIDQDKSWVKPWDSFNDLYQFFNWKKDLIDYYVGIKPKEYYEISSRYNDFQNKYKEIEAKKNTLIDVQKNFNSNKKNVEFDMNIETYRTEINILLEESNRLILKEEKYKENIVLLRNSEITLEQQIKIAKLSLKELNSDYEYTVESLTGNHVECPTCGTGFDNSLSHRFSLLEDVESCQNIILELDHELNRIRSEIKIHEDEFSKNNLEIESINRLLREKKGMIEFKDIIKSESQKEIKRTFEEKIKEYDNNLQAIGIRKNELESEKKEYTDKLRTNNIKTTFKNHMSTALFKLNVDGLTEEQYKDIPTDFKEFGSDRPRALIAYYYSILKTIYKHSSDGACFFPIIIDSPNQQDQDCMNLPKIMEFILREKPESTQLILGSVDLYGVSHDGEEITLMNKYSLLSESEYNEINEFIYPLLEIANSNLT